MQRERDAREARQLDREIRAQERHYQSESKKHKDAVDKASSAAISTQVHTQLRQGNRGSNNDRKTSTTTPPSRSPRNSVERTTLLAEHTLASDPFLQLSSPSGPLLSEDSTLKSFEAVSDCFQTIGIVFSCKFFFFQEILSTLTSPKSHSGTPSASLASYKQLYDQSDHSPVSSHTIRQDSPGPATSNATTAVAGSTPITFAVAALATVAPILPLGVTTLQDDSTESEQSLTGSQGQSEALHRFM